MRASKICGLIVLFFSLACATSQHSDCPTPEDEPVSSCRAQYKCRQKKTNYSVGLAPSGQVADNFGLEPDLPSPATENYTDCIAKDLELQKGMQQTKKIEKDQ